ncbi:hypothetical protein PPL_11197 [Heterostelium album PN500]|uniref:Uncharacterized protein n=1 Tax=Heterostelium pallidum (strain ATCC 26659 / Pp 5 / PN500) TaxID=670386 RepID=D3BTT7_HETP5|nr:hypothetical protein PPL_11197 [Heterostelium album PN500]EFA75123.1 hypothetical protein PPL_11197 [Heterostelium album PN500]|eukprot:XP_020427257.1 hypothetical protein PPL_11197 [Heterostelium album PN500]
MNINNNIQDLPYLLISKILSFKELTVLDSICFSLTSKKLYNNRDKYLIFNDHQLTHAKAQLIYNRSNHVTLRSYTKQFQQISDIQSCKLLICDHQTSLKKEYTNLYDYTIDITNMKNTDNLSEKIPLNVKCIHVLNWSDDCIFNISDSSISELFIVTGNKLKIISGSLPNTLEKITIYNRLNDYVLPNSVRTMKFDCRNQQFISGLFPQSLESLELAMHLHPLVENSLPNLKSLHLSSYNPTSIVNIGNLPTSLQTLVFEYGYFGRIENISAISQFQRLTTIEGCRLEWVASLPPSVTSLKFSACFQDTNNIEPGVIPSTITNLYFADIGKVKLQSGSIPSSVRKLTILGYKYDLEAGVIPIGVKEFYILLRSAIFTVECIPSTVESLKITIFLNCHRFKSVDLHSLPSIKKLSLGIRNTKISKFPPNLESLKFKLSGDAELLYSSLPSTLKELTLIYTKLIIDSWNVGAHHQPKRLIMKVDSFYFNENRLEDLPISVEIVKISNAEFRRCNSSCLFIGHNREYPVNGGFIESTEQLRDLLYYKVLERNINNHLISSFIT